MGVVATQEMIVLDADASTDIGRTDKQTQRQTDKTGRQTDRQTSKQAGKSADRQDKTRQRLAAA